MNNHIVPSRPQGPFVLVIEPEVTTARRLLSALGERGGRLPTRRAGDEVASSVECLVLQSLTQLEACDLELCELVLCGVHLPDGNGLAAVKQLTYRHADLPVILIGRPEDAGVAVRAIRLGAADFLTTAGHDLHALPMAVERCLANRRVRQENEQLQTLVRRLEAAARTDDLTGLSNRRSLNEMFNRAWRAADERSRPMSFLMIDIDDFKTVNDIMGHLRGDEVLREVARIIQDNCRSCDLAARFGGDEFCVLLPEGDDREAVQLAHRILHEWERAALTRPPGQPKVGLSIGVAQITPEGITDTGVVEELIRRADEALYAAKGGGKGRVMLHTPEAVVDAPPKSQVEIDQGLAVRW